MRTQTMSGKDYLRLLNVERGKHCAWQSVVGGWMVVFKGSTRTITIKINRIHLAIVKRGDNIAYPALFVITETRKRACSIFLFIVAKDYAGNNAPADYYLLLMIANTFS